MAVREFDGTDDIIRLGAGGLSAMTHGTLAMLVKIDAVGSGCRTLYCGLDSGGFFEYTAAQFCGASPDHIWHNGSTGNAWADDPPTAVWLLFVIRKATGTATPRRSLYNFNTATWAHANFPATIADWAAIGASGSIATATDDAISELFDGRIAVMAAWSNEVHWTADGSGDSAIEAAGLEDLLSNWVDEAPDALWAFNQATVGDPVPDYVGTSNQVALTGTTVVEGDDPPGFTFDVDPPAAPIAHDTFTRFPATSGDDTTTGDRTFSHAGSASAKGVVVVLFNATNATEDGVTGVTYGGVALEKRATGSDTTEPGRVTVWALPDDTECPTGTQDVVLQGASAVAKWCSVATVTAGTTGTKVNATVGVNTTVSTNPSGTLVTTATTLAYGGVHSGLGTVGSLTLGAGYISMEEEDYGAKVGRASRDTDPVASGSRPYNWTAASDDWCLAAVALEGFDLAAGPGNVAWTPGELTLSAVAWGTTPQPVSVAWVPGTLTGQPVAWGVTPLPVSIAWMPGQLTVDPVAWGAAPIPPSVAWSAGEFTLAPVAWDATPGLVSVPWAPGQLTAEPVAWGASPQAVTIAWATGQLTVQPVAWGASPQPVSILWTPGTFGLDPVAWGVVVEGEVNWPPGLYTLEPVAWGVTPLPVSVAWAPAQFTLTPVAWGAAPQAVHVPWTPGELILEGVPVALVPGLVTTSWTPGIFILEPGSVGALAVQVPPWTILRAVAWAVELEGVGPEPQLVAVGQGGLVEHTLKIGDVRTLAYDLRRDLTGVLTVTFRVVAEVGDPLIIDRAGTVVDVAAGLVDLDVLAGDYGAGLLEMSLRHPQRRPFLLEALTMPGGTTHPNRGQEILWLEPTVA